MALIFHPYWGGISRRILRKKMGLMRRFTNTIKSCLGQQSHPNQKLHRGKYPLYFSVWIQYLDCFQNPALSTARGRGPLITSPIRHFAAVTGKYTFGERWQLWNFLQKSYIIWREVCWENMFSHSFTALRERERKAGWSSLPHTLLRHECRETVSSTLIHSTSLFKLFSFNPNLNKYVYFEKSECNWAHFCIVSYSY